MSVTPESFAVEVVVTGVPKRLAYRLLPELEGVDVGAEVTVPVGSRQARGWVVEKITLTEAVSRLEEILALAHSKGELSKGASSIEQPPDSQLGFFSEESFEKNPNISTLKSVLSASPAFLPEQIKLFEWMAEYYGSSLVDVIDNAVPKRMEFRAQLFVRPITDEVQRLFSDAEQTEKLHKRAPLQLRVLRALEEAPGPVSITELEELGTVRPAIKALEEKGFVESFSSLSQDRDFAVAQDPSISNSEPPALTASQSTALEKINAAIGAKTFSPILLYGVTGSGKTEVYISAIKSVLAAGGSALVIVPEIALTPQLLDQFQSRLSVPLALLHSQVGTGARWGAWEALLDGKIRVAIGARSAVFAPLKNLSLVIVDEEHESSYKQSEGLRYNGRDVAIMRAKLANCPVVLGSATPSFESLLNAKKNRYQLLEMPDRVTTRPLPQIEVVDLREIKRREMASENVSPQLYTAINETLEKKGQVVILYNRRGFASYLQCDTCSEVVMCPNCSVPFTFHQRQNHLLCHYCNLSIDPPSHCRFCRDPRTSQVELDSSGEQFESDKKVDKVGKLSHRGGGTERVVEELAALFPAARIVRMDRDTVGAKDSYRKILGSMRSGEADILVGTQMIAKGHDLPGVTLVGIVDADVGLHLPDFRSSEKAFQLITQAAGRAGRGKDQGRVILQTREPEHPTIVATVTGRFLAFARYELDFRKSLNYPPWGRLLRLVISNTDKDLAGRTAQMVTDEVARLASHYTATDETGRLALSVLGPAIAPHEKLRGRYRFHLLIKANSAKTISQLATDLNRWKQGVKVADFRLSVDVDPVDMM